MKKINLNIVGMSCVNCADAIKRVTSKIDGVKSANVNFATSGAVYEIDSDGVEEEIKKSIKKLGYDVVDDYDSLQASKEKHIKNLFIKFICSISIFSVVMFLEMSKILPFFINGLICAILSFVVVFYFGYSIISAGLNSLKTKEYDMNTLITLGALSAYIYSIISLFFTHYLYFSSSTGVLSFIFLGQFLEERSKLKANDYIKNLISLTPKSANLIVDNVIKSVPINSLKLNDLVLVKEGELIPSDGIIKKGSALIDQSMITGESLPVLKEVGQEVSAGCINTSGTIEILINKEFINSTLSEILKLLSDASNKKMPISRFADVIASKFVPVVVILAFISLIVWSLLGHFYTGVVCFVSVLIISCPCALGLATPIAIVCSLSNGAKNGILIKNPAILEFLKNIKIFIFDKTGTLTNAKLSVIYSSLDEVTLKMVGEIELLSDHIIAKVIAKYANAKNKFEGDFKEEIANGVIAKNSSNEIIIGKKEFLLEKNIKVDIDKKYLNGAYNIVCVGINGSFKGYIVLSDEIKKDAKDVIANLKNRGIKTILLTGDNQVSGNLIGNKLGLDEIYSSLLPNDKFNITQNLAKKSLVAFVGDGINDAPSMKIASAGICMGSGNDIARQSGDVVLIRNDLKSVLNLLNLSSKTMACIKQNLFWALIYNVICIPIAMGVFYHFGFILKPIFASIAMMCSSIFVVLNSIRLKFKDISK